MIPLSIKIYSQYLFVYVDRSFALSQSEACKTFNVMVSHDLWKRGIMMTSQTCANLSEPVFICVSNYVYT